MKKILFATWILIAACLGGRASAQIKYQGEVNVSVGAAFLGAGYNNTFLKGGLETVHGVRFNPYWFLGGGVGAHEYFWLGDDPSYDVDVPIFANAKYYMMPDRRVSPYAGMDVGYGIGMRRQTGSGLYLSPALGAHFRLGKKLGLNVGLTYQLQGWGKDSYGIRMWQHGVAAKAGFTW